MALLRNLVTSSSHGDVLRPGLPPSWLGRRFPLRALKSSERRFAPGGLCRFVPGEEQSSA